MSELFAKGERTSMAGSGGSVDGSGIPQFSIPAMGGERSKARIRSRLSGRCSGGGGVSRAMSATADNVDSVETARSVAVGSPSASVLSFTTSSDEMWVRPCWLLACLGLRMMMSD